MDLIYAFLRNPTKVAVGVLLVVLFGFIALTRMPMQLTPEVETPTLSIETLWPGASPQEVEREIIQEQEEQLKGVEGVVKMTSESMDSRGKIVLEFSVGQNMDEALLMVNSRLQQVREYPVDADQPVITTSNASDQPIAWFMLSERFPDRAELVKFAEQHPDLQPAIEKVLSSRNEALLVYRLRKAAEEHPELRPLLPVPVEIQKMRRFAEDRIEARFERVDGVSQANVIGGREEEMQVIVDPEKLAARQLTIADVRNALVSANQDVSAGDIWEGKRRMVIRTLGQFRSPQEVEEVLIARRDGHPVYVRDVATVALGYKKPDGVVKRFGSESIAVNALRTTGANVLDVMAGLQAAAKELNEGILKENNLSLLQVYDETEYIYSAVGLVQSNIVVGGILTICVLLLFLRSGRSTLVLALAIPTSIIGTFLVMDTMGRSLNVISLAGLAFAVGMLVDNAVVVLENIYRHYQNGDDPFTAAAKGTHEVWGAVVASTLTTLAVFLPVLFVEQEAGQLFRDIAIAISAGVFLSLIVAITVIPVAASRVLRRQESHDEAPAGNSHPHRHETLPGDKTLLSKLLAPLDWFGRTFVASIVSFNRFLQKSVMLRLILAFGMVAVAVFGSYVLMPQVDYLPAGNRNLVMGIMIPPPGYNLEELETIGKEVEQTLLPFWDVDPGSPEAQELAFPIVEDFFFVVRGRMVFLGARAADPTRAADLVPLINMAVAGKPGTMGIANQRSLFERGIGGGTKVDVDITGPSLEKLVALGGRVMGGIAAINEQRNQGIDDPLVRMKRSVQPRPVPSLDLNSPETHVRAKREQAEDMKMTNIELGYAVNALVDGAYAADYYQGGKKIDLSILGSEEFTRRTQDLRALPIATPTGELVSLEALAFVDEFSTGPEQINHRERERAITIEAYPPVGMPLEELRNQIQSSIIDPIRAEGELGKEYQIVVGGTADKLRDTWEALRFNFVLALLITYLLMAALFESWVYPFVIILTVPLGAVGGLAGLALLNFIGQFYGVYQALDVLTMLGFVILIGTVVNNPILIVEQSLNHMRIDGMEPRAAILESVRTRVRPIFMTTITTVMGLLPLVLFPGSGSELYRGLGAVLLGGLLLSTVFTLVLVPTVFSLFLDARTAIAGLFDRKTQAAEAPKRETPPPLPARTPAASEGLALGRDVTAEGRLVEHLDLSALETNGHGNGEHEHAASETIAPTDPRRRLPAR